MNKHEYEKFVLELAEDVMKAMHHMREALKLMRKDPGNEARIEHVETAFKRCQYLLDDLDKFRIENKPVDN